MIEQEETCVGGISEDDAWEDQRLRDEVTQRIREQTARLEHEREQYVLQQYQERLHDLTADRIDSVSMYTNTVYEVHKILRIEIEESRQENVFLVGTQCQVIGPEADENGPLILLIAHWRKIDLPKPITLMQDEGGI